MSAIPSWPYQRQKVIPALADYGLVDQLVAMMKAVLVFVTGFLQRHSGMWKMKIRENRHKSTPGAERVCLAGKQVIVTGYSAGSLGVG